MAPSIVAAFVAALSVVIASLGAFTGMREPEATAS